LWVFSPPHFCGCWNAPRSFIATAKTSYTTGTLYDIFSYLYWLELRKEESKEGRKFVEGLLALA